MATNLDLNDDLIEQARRAGSHKSKKAAVTAALEEYLKSLRRKRLLTLVGTIDYDPRYSHKKERRRR